MLDSMLPNTLPEPEHTAAVGRIVAWVVHIVVVVGRMVVHNVRESALGLLRHNANT